MSTAPESGILIGTTGKIFAAVMNAIIPRGGAFEKGAADADLLPLADMLLAGYEPMVRRMFPFMLRYIQYGALLRTGRVFTALDDARAGRFLAKMETSPLMYRRLIMLFMKVLTLLSFYEDDETARLAGYVHGCHLRARSSGRKAAGSAASGKKRKRKSARLSGN